MGSTSAADNGNVHATGIELLAMPGELPIEQSRREEAVALHPVDRGWHAWLFVVCASGLEVCVWGFPLWSEICSPLRAWPICLINGMGHKLWDFPGLVSHS